MQIEEGYQPHGPDYWVWPPGRTDHWGIAPPKPVYVKDAQLAIRFAELGQ
jgi:catechol 2,3-dioxygenase